MTYFFTADEHYGHRNIIKYCGRPFSSVEEMNEEIIKRHNEVVGNNDTVYHIGDFILGSQECAASIIEQLNGSHVFIDGSHDKWLAEPKIKILEKHVHNQLMVLCHYCMRVWPKSHYNSIHLYGHSHGRLEPIGKSWDVGVDNNDFYPLSDKQILEIMKNRPDNPNKVDK